MARVSHLESVMDASDRKFRLPRLVLVAMYYSAGADFAGLETSTGANGT